MTSFTSGLFWMDGFQLAIARGQQMPHHVFPSLVMEFGDEVGVHRHFLDVVVAAAADDDDDDDDDHVGNDESDGDDVDNVLICSNLV